MEAKTSWVSRTEVAPESGTPKDKTDDKCGLCCGYFQNQGSSPPGALINSHTCASLFASHYALQPKNTYQDGKNQVNSMSACICFEPRHWLSSKESACQYRRRRRCRSDPLIGKIPWRRKWQLTPVFLPEESHGQRSLAGYSPWGCKELDILSTHTQHANASEVRVCVCARLRLVCVSVRVSGLLGSLGLNLGNKIPPLLGVSS